MPDETARSRALARAAYCFDSGAFRDRLAALIAIPSTSQEADAAPALSRYLREGIAPWLDRLGFAHAIHPNPAAGFGPILTAARIEDPGLPTVLTY
ncbi:MAG: M20 peptidase family dipeptidase, partial [Acetobacteraceae bacterium]